MDRHRCFPASLSLDGVTWTVKSLGWSGPTVDCPRAAYVMYFPGFPKLYQSSPVEYMAMMALEALELVGISIAIIW